MDKKRNIFAPGFALATLAIILLPAPTAKADYWSGTAPFCNGQCNGHDVQKGAGQCGDGACCWTGHKVLCGSPTEACPVRETNTECFGVVEVCDNGYYSSPNQVWHSCNKFACGLCFGFSIESQRVFTSNRCKEGFVWRGAVVSDEICVPPTVRDQAARDNEAAASRREPNGSFGPDTCKQGFVWREVTPTDHVCVTPQTRADNAAYNQAAREHVVTSDKPYGPDTCKQGFVWREAIADDHVCVTPTVRERARQDNAQAAARRAPGGGPSGQDSCKQGFVWREVVPTDHICVAPDVRDEAAADNRAAHDRRVPN